MLMYTLTLLIDFSLAPPPFKDFYLFESVLEQGRRAEREEGGENLKQTSP